MTEEIILVRDDHKIPWGFRLTGGRDFNSPLTVVRITGQSIAECRGLKAGDIITEINGQKTNNLCHNEAQRYIVDGGNFLKFIVLRGSSPAIPQALTPVRGMTPVLPVCNFEKKKPSTSIISAESVYSLYEDDSFEFLDQDQSEDEYSEFHEPTEDEINQMLLENAEVIEEKGKNVIGVNFKRFIPKCEFIKDSAVFQVLQEEQVHKELSEKEQLKKCPNKRFSTFLAPPDRPIPQPKPKLSPEIKTEQADQSENITESDENRSSELNDQNELTNEESSQNETESDDRNDNIDDETENETVENETTGDESNSADNDLVEGNVQLPKTEFEVQLNLIKNTLSSLEQLPSLIQSQLAAIQNQITQLTQLKDNSSSSNGQDEETDSKSDTDIAQETGEIDENAELRADYDENAEFNDDYDENPNEMGQQDSDVQFENTEPTLTESEPNENHSDEETRPNKSKKISDEEEHPKRRPACPLTPLPRPVVLPGGRIWRKPKDAYNEEFIAETLISQAEVLVGSTVGVNFRKYEPPKFDLSNSAVYKLVHNIETKEAGLQNRDTIPSLQDYYQSPISARHFYCANLANRRTAIEEEDSQNENQQEISS
ncbi:myb-like protein X [Planococcus citri]|uniref:myb-like protein X n=1 Tax=Planococcus citri TaxID=170843 RepID=UPI0031F93187